MKGLSGIPTILLLCFTCGTHSSTPTSSTSRLTLSPLEAKLKWEEMKQLRDDQIIYTQDLKLKAEFLSGSIVKGDNRIFLNVDVMSQGIEALRQEILSKYHASTDVQMIMITARLLGGGVLPLMLINDGSLEKILSSPDLFTRYMTAQIKQNDGEGGDEPTHGWASKTTVEGNVIHFRYDFHNHLMNYQDALACLREFGSFLFTSTFSILSAKDPDHLVNHIYGSNPGTLIPFGEGKVFPDDGFITDKSLFIDLRDWDEKNKTFTKNDLKIVE